MEGDADPEAGGDRDQEPVDHLRIVTQVSEPIWLALSTSDETIRDGVGQR